MTDSASSKRRAWVIAGVIAVAFTIAVVAFSTLRAQPPLEAGPAATDAPHDEFADETSESPSLEWPANMAGGGVLYADEMMPERSVAPDDSTAPETREVDRAGGPVDILVYVDYRCPACIAFDATNGETLVEAVTSGTATLEVRALTFLDRANPDDFYSTRAAAAQACVIDGQPEAAWDTHEVLLEPGFAPEGTEVGATDDELAEAFDQAVEGLDDEVHACIREQRFVPFANAMNQWTFSHPVPNATDPALEVTGTPFVVVGGEHFAGDIHDAGAFREFLAEQGVELAEQGRS